VIEIENTSSNIHEYNQTACKIAQISVSCLFFLLLDELVTQLSCEHIDKNMKKNQEHDGIFSKKISKFGTAHS